MQFFVINDLVGNLTYIYHYIETDGTNNVTVTDAVANTELTILGVITEETGTALTTDDVIA